MTTLKVNTISGIGNTEGTVFKGGVGYDSLNYMTLPKGTTNQRVNSAGGRAVIPGGYNPAGSPNAAKSLNTIEYISIQTTGNALDFGDMISYTGQSGGATCNATRALWGGSYNTAIGYITMATLGNAQDFGDAVNAWGHRPAMSSSTRGMWGGGKGPASPYPVKTEVDYVEIATTGNAKDFGDLSEARSAGGGTSNGHGGL